MKWLIYGAKGWIGSQICELLRAQGEQVIVGVSRLDQNPEQEILAEQPDRVVCLTGRTHGIYQGEQINTIDILEKPGMLVQNLRDNLVGLVRLSHWCREYKIHCTIMGTGCIFTYDDKHPEPFTEVDHPNFTGSSYSTVKGAAEELLRLHSDNTLLLRLRMPISGDLNPRNFITKITTYQKVISIPNSMSVLHTLLPVLITAATRKVVGVLNFTNPGTITHNRILELYKEIVDPNFTWQNFSIEEQDKILASKRSNNALDTTRLQTLFPTVPNIEDAVKEALFLIKHGAK